MSCFVTRNEMKVDDLQLLLVRDGRIQCLLIAHQTEKIFNCQKTWKHNSSMLKGILPKFPQVNGHGVAETT